MTMETVSIGGQKEGDSINDAVTTEQPPGKTKLIPTTLLPWRLIPDD